MLSTSYVRSSGRQCRFCNLINDLIYLIFDLIRLMGYEYNDFRFQAISGSYLFGLDADCR